MPVVLDILGENYFTSSKNWSYPSKCAVL